MNTFNKLNLRPASYFKTNYLSGHIYRLITRQDVMDEQTIEMNDSKSIVFEVIYSTNSNVTNIWDQIYIITFISLCICLYL